MARFIDMLTGHGITTLVDCAHRAALAPQPESRAQRLAEHFSAGST